MTSNIDRSLDEIIKEQKKAKRQQQQKQKKQVVQKGRGKGKPTTARQGKLVRKRGQNLKQQTSKQTGPPARVRRNAVGKPARNKGKTRVQANPLKNRQNMGSKLVKKARKTRVNAAQNRQTRRQAQQKQSRQNQLNRRRGIQTNQLQRRNKEAKVQSRQFQGGNKTQNRRPVLKRPKKDLMLTVNISNPQANSRLGTFQGTSQGQGRRRRWRQSGGTMGTGVLATSNFNLAASRQELRVSVANNLHKPLPSLPRSTKKEIYNIPERFDFNLGKTTSSLNERFSSSSQPMNEPSSSRTIFVE